ncbi:MAG: hypothetical protein HeimC3_33910 [Candidatus Heimdallarchaeota archaeon LC_3]|nr:MAG: hypothetical protein HeimC3_33910 [Candidatus Heimdallarchaeota archaeon LC_3]
MSIQHRIMENYVEFCLRILEREQTQFYIENYLIKKYNKTEKRVQELFDVRTKSYEKCINILNKR